MERSELRTYCLSKQAVIEDFPFGEEVAVYKVEGKVFALLPVDEPTSISLKCDPTLAGILRETYAAVTPGWHLNKKHWNTVNVDGSIPDNEILEMVDHSYEQVVKGLPKKVQAMLNKDQS
jgi:predicted DNA-binding protein (MmcQ/YjbR family)